MPLFSMFNPFGALAFSSKPSRIRQIYDANIAILNKEPNDNFNLDKGSNYEATIYARSRTQAAVRLVLERAYNNAQPGKATDTIPSHEEEYEVVPGPSDSLQDRRAVLAARALLPNGATFVNVTNALSALLGSGFKYYRVTKVGEVVNFPATGGDSPGNFVLPSTVIKNYTVTDATAGIVGVLRSFSYVGFEDGTPPLLNGDVLVVDAAILGETERVTVSEVTTTTFKANFTKAHPESMFASTAPYPYWVSTQRHALIVVSRAVKESNDACRKINELLARILRGVSTWTIVPELTPGTTAAFTIDDPVLGRLDYAAIDTFTYP